MTSYLHLADTSRQEGDLLLTSRYQWVQEDSLGPRVQEIKGGNSEAHLEKTRLRVRVVPSSPGSTQLESQHLNPGPMPAAFH